MFSLDSSPVYFCVHYRWRLVEKLYRRGKWYGTCLVYATANDFLLALLRERD